jgi:hypothetical protein
VDRSDRTDSNDDHVTTTLYGFVHAPGMDQPERDRVSTDAVRAPLLRDGLGEADDGCFRGGVIGLADVAVQAGGGGDVDYGPVFAVFRLGVRVRVIGRGVGEWKGGENTL